MSELRVHYLCLQATREGQASHAHVREIIAGLEELGMDVTLFEPRFAAEGQPIPGALGRALEFRGVQRRLRRAPRPDVLYIRAHFAALPTARWALAAGIPVVQEVNGPYEDLFAAWPWTRRFRKRFEHMMREQYASADELITVTAELQAWLERETGRTADLVTNGANVELFRPDAPRPPGLPERYVVFFGALAVWQGIGTLLAAVREPAWPEGVSLVIAGDGAERAAVEAAAREDGRVCYLGRLPYRDVAGVVAGAIAGMSPKTSEQLAETGASPLKLFETLACGTPVVVSDIPGLGDIVREHDAGLVVPSADSAALAAAVAALASDPERASAMGERGHAAIVSEHSWRARAKATADIIRSAASSRTAR